MKAYMLMLLVVVGIFAGCTSHLTMNRGVTEASELHALSQAFGQTNSESMMDLLNRSQSASGAMENIIQDEASRLGPNRVQSRWVTAKDIFHGQAIWVNMLHERSLDPRAGIEPQLAGVVRRLSELTRAQSEHLIALYWGESRAISEMARATWTRHSFSAPIDELTMNEQADLLLQAIRRLEAYSNLLSFMVEQAGVSDPQWLAQIEMAELHRFACQAALEGLISEGFLAPGLLHGLDTISSATAWRITARLYELIPGLRGSYSELSRSNFLFLAGESNADVYAFANYRRWIHEKEPRSREVSLELLVAMWGAFREQHPEAYQGSGMSLERETPSARERALFDFGD